MGRPIQKRRIGLGSTKIEVSSARFSTGGVVSGNIDDPIYIQRQRGTLQFLVTDSASGTSEKLKLVGKATPAAGEFNIRVIVDTTIDGDISGDSTTYYVTRLHNKTVTCQADNDPTTSIHLPYVLSATGDGTPGQDLAFATIDVQK